MILLRLISWPYFRKHVLRTLLTTAGIVLGVAVFVGMHTANQSVLFALFTAPSIASPARPSCRSRPANPDSTKRCSRRVQASPTVRVAVPVIEAVVDTGSPGEGSLLILGVDMTGDRSLRDYDLESGDDAIIDDPLVFLAQPDSLIVTQRVRRAQRLAVGSTLPLGTVEGRRSIHRPRHHEVVAA